MYMFEGHDGQSITAALEDSLNSTNDHILDLWDRLSDSTSVNEETELPV